MSDFYDCLFRWNYPFSTVAVEATFFFSLPTTASQRTKQLSWFLLSCTSHSRFNGVFFFWLSRFCLSFPGFWEKKSDLSLKITLVRAKHHRQTTTKIHTKKKQTHFPYFCIWHGLLRVPYWIEIRLIGQQKVTGKKAIEQRKKNRMVSSFLGCTFRYVIKIRQFAPVKRSVSKLAGFYWKTSFILRQLFKNILVKVQEYSGL